MLNNGGAIVCGDITPSVDILDESFSDYFRVSDSAKKGIREAIDLQLVTLKQMALPIRPVLEGSFSSNPDYLGYSLTKARYLTWHQIEEMDTQRYYDVFRHKMYTFLLCGFKMGILHLEDVNKIDDMNVLFDIFSMERRAFESIVSGERSLQDHIKMKSSNWDLWRKCYPYEKSNNSFIQLAQRLHHSCCEFCCC